jgi:enamine deaminase RidA (YjgF/YER057c/UK114 family)
LQRAAGALDAISSILRITVYVRSAADFTQQSEVADGASDLVARILKQSGVHVCTSVSVLQLPKDAAVELDVVATIKKNGWHKTWTAWGQRHQRRQN